MDRQYRRAADEVWRGRGQTTWVLRTPAVTSALIGASKPEQIRENVEAVKGVKFTAEELERI